MTMDGAREARPEVNEGMQRSSKEKKRVALGNRQKELSSDFKASVVSCPLYGKRFGGAKRKGLDRLGRSQAKIHRKRKALRYGAVLKEVSWGQLQMIKRYGVGACELDQREITRSCVVHSKNCLRAS